MNENANGKNLRKLSNVDRLIHEPARLMIMAFLTVVEEVDFTFLMNQTGLTRGNLSSHMTKLENANYIKVKKTFVNKMPRTLFKVTETGRNAFQSYRQSMRQLFDELPE